MKHHILLVDDDEIFRIAMSSFLHSEGFLVTAVSNGEEAVALVRQDIEEYSLALIDYHMPYFSGAETIKSLKSYNPDLIIYTFSGDDSNEAYNDALGSGAVFFIQKDISTEKLLGLLHRTCKDVESKTKEIVVSKPSDNQLLIEKINMIGSSEQMAAVAKLVMKFAPLNETVLILGENGTGKDKVAKAIHANSLRSKSPFIAVNCAAITESLMESELFGYNKGAFTGATKDKVGFFEAAHGGTLFLDEIGEMPKHIQSKLLRIIQEKEITRVGSTEVKKIDFRLIAATNVNLEDKIAKDLFREDLYYRLNVLPIELKPLRERPDDIPILVQYFLKEANHEQRDNKKVLANSVEQLKSLVWSGNVRELKQAIHLLVATSTGEYLEIAEFVKSQKAKGKNTKDIKTQRVFKERTQIKNALVKAGTITSAARMLKISRSTFRERMKKYKIALNSANLEGEVI